MKLLNNTFKWPATVFFYSSVLVGIYSISFDNELDKIWKVPVYSLFGSESGFLGLGKKGWTETAIFNEVLTVLIVCSGLMASFSKEKVEDELISKIRLTSLSAAIIINYAVLLIANFLTFDLSFLMVLIVFLFAPLVMFNIIFQIRLIKYYKLDHEE